MCKNCKIIEEVFQAAKSEAHMNYFPIYRMLEAMLAQNRIEVYAGDCPFGEALEVLNSDQHYTVSFYLECSRCYDIYFFGACIRGTPVYKKVENINREPVERLLWGKEGRYFRD